MEQLLHYCWKHKLWPIEGLQTTDGQEVEVAGADKRFVNVEATIEGAEVRFQSPIAQPVYVRYAWKDNPRASIYNKKGMPAMPFEYQIVR